MCAERLTCEQSQVRKVVAVLVTRQHGVRLFQVQMTCKDTVATVSVLRSPERDTSTSLWPREVVVPDE